jgi:hypothetical protein
VTLLMTKKSRKKQSYGSYRGLSITNVLLIRHPHLAMANEGRLNSLRTLYPAHADVVGERIIRQRLSDAFDLIIISALRKHQ